MIRSRRHLPLVFAVVLGCSSCLGPLDTLGLVSVTSQFAELFKDPAVEDDRIEDKHPACRSDLTLEETFSDCTFTVNKSCSVTKLDVVDFPAGDEDLETRLYPTRRAALQDLNQRGGDILPSMEVINGVLKPFNDGLYASIEIGAQLGIDGVFPGKKQFLVDLATAAASALEQASTETAPHLERGLELVVGAMLAGDQDVSELPLDPSLVARARQTVDSWLLAALESRPIGFYTWDPVLESVFRQDRFLQNRASVSEQDQPPSTEEFGRLAALASLIEGTPHLRDAYDRLVALPRGLTNRYASYSAADLYPYVDGPSSLADLAGARAEFLSDNDAPFVCRGTWLALLPASRSPDTDFFQDLFCTTPVPPDANLINGLINAIRDGLLDLTPDAGSGWYEYQLYALETLLVPESLPESDHLLLTAAYKKKLIETFKSLITQTRETHVKQLTIFTGPGSAGPPREVEVYPSFPVEPFPTFYLRTARAYRFLETYLQAVLGEEFLLASHRLNEDGTASVQTLKDELHDITRLVYGFYLVSARAVGLDPSDYLLEEETLEHPLAECDFRARQWISGWQSDPDVLKDPRVIVPVGRTEPGGDVIYWAVLGVKVVRINASFVEGYVPTFTGSVCTVKEIKDHDYLLLMEEMQELRIPESTPPPTREELRAVCNQHDNAADIVAALEAL
ncbi:MAG: hypothetical protein RBU30_07695 [Polyangia bacterium]|jgi:hypothetical protein|nr:hypothetical protein [Polyangia bacterium]